eukprot:CAMPEP_0113852564 /NCGR_PEP_ID=MMETSP0372-20130328/5615_1 /TAXON_ID=340204 /ORGANISM="Lankesteria abbotti" /LENGTH=86 /DNA_ID=CAMNT_0000824197 /DNA_START=100 /DNA_END=360 /DNA_ORIENTATION=+ /assembly_acc=CAM_ASM_000359
MNKAPKKETVSISRVEEHKRALKKVGIPVEPVEPVVPVVLGISTDVGDTTSTVGSTLTGAIKRTGFHGNHLNKAVNQSSVFRNCDQ